MSLQVHDVRALPGDSAFLLDDGETAVLYDTGFAFTGNAVAENIRSILGARPLDMILLTHSHYDHALGTPYICARYPMARVVAGEYAARIFAKPTARAKMREMDQKFAARCDVGAYEDRVDELRVDLCVNDGDTVRVGAMEFTAVALPGHTKCSVGYYLSSERLLLSSETLGVYDGDKIVCPSFLVGYGMTLSSIERAERLEIERMVLPHYGLADRETTAFYRSLCRESAERTAEGIVRVLRAGGTQADAVQFFKDSFYHGGVPRIYPEDAMLLNTGIMVDLIAKELMGEEI